MSGEYPLDDLRRAEAAEARLRQAERERDAKPRLVNEDDEAVVLYEDYNEVAGYWHEAESKLEAAEARLRQTEQALRVYARADNWMQDEHGSWLFDCPATTTPYDFARAALDAQPADQACTCQGVWSAHGYVVSHGPGCTLDAQPAAQRSRREA